MDILKGNQMEYNDGNSRRLITPVHLRFIRSKVRTHEGELLYGKKGEAYQDKYSKKYLGKDLSNSYRNDRIK